jgi:hypothetical protein
MIKSNVLGAIADIESALIPDTIKRKALIEICRMASDSKYARRVEFKFKLESYEGIDSMFIWDKTYAGKKFWERLNRVIS